MTCMRKLKLPMGLTHHRPVAHRIDSSSRAGSHFRVHLWLGLRDLGLSNFLAVTFSVHTVESLS